MSSGTSSGAQQNDAQDTLCGSANGAFALTAPTTGLCKAGAASTNFKASDTEWSWGCEGQSDHKSTACKAFIPTHSCLPYKPTAPSALIDNAIPSAVPGIKRAIFAHSMSSFPLGYEAHSGPDDYYNVQAMNPVYYGGSGEDFRLIGGRLRMRPLYAPDKNVDTKGSHFNENKYANVKREIHMAIARGITGFTQFIGNPDELADMNGTLNLLLKAAQETEVMPDGSPRFRVMIMTDLLALNGNASRVLTTPDHTPTNDEIAERVDDSVYKIYRYLADKPAAFRLADGRLVVTTFEADKGMTIPRWKAIFDRLNLDGVRVAFIMGTPKWKKYTEACMSASTTCMNNYQNDSFGFADWGDAVLNSAANFLNDPALAHLLRPNPLITNKLLFMMPIRSQEYHVRGSPLIKNDPSHNVIDRPTAWEARNSDLIRTYWNSAINGGADMVQLVTWNDFDEATIIQPYTDRTLANDIGNGFYNITGYYSTWYLTGQKPVVTHDVLYYIYRREPTNAAVTSAVYNLGYIDDLGAVHPGKDTAAQPFSDQVEMLAFVKEKRGTLRITFPDLPPFTRDISSEEDNVISFKVSTHPGIPTFELIRDGKEVISYQAGVRIYGQNGLPDGTQDLTYWSGSGSEAGKCTITTPDP